MQQSEKSERAVAIKAPSTPTGSLFSPLKIPVKPPVVVVECKSGTLDNKALKESQPPLLYSHSSKYSRKGVETGVEVVYCFLKV